MNEQLRPLTIIYNRNSGFHAARRDELYEEILTQLSTCGFEIQVLELHSNSDFDQLMQDVLDRHLNGPDAGVVVAAGGDGTLNAVGAKLLHTDIPLGLLPLGTFNYVARALNIPLDLLEATKVIISGRPQAIHVAKLNNQIYLNNASLGLYPLFIKRREAYNQRFGRFTFNAYASALDVMIRDRKALKLTLEVDGKRYPLNTPLVFFGNNQLQLQEMRLRVADCAAAGRVAGVAVANTDKRTLFKLLFQLIQGKLEQASQVYSFCADQVQVHAAKKNIKVAIDGEIVELQTPLKITVEKNALNIMVPYAAPSL